VSRGRDPGSISGRPEECGDGGRRVPVRGSEAGNCPWLVSMLRSGTDSKNLCIGQYDKFFEEYCLLPKL
jgi:hypothetical protein